MLVKRNGTKRIPYVPRWVGPIEGHAVNVSKSFFSQLCAFYEFDDLLQEAYIVFMKCKRAYPKVDNRAWFMGIFKNALRNRMIGLLEHRATRYNFIEDVTDIEEPVKDDNTFLGIVLRELPCDVQELLATFVGSSEQKSRAAYRKLCKMFPEAAT